MHPLFFVFFSCLSKNIHLIWLGSERPKKFDFLLELIRDKNKDYHIKEWTDNNIDFDLINMKMYVKYNDLIDANLLLGILERVAITAYYNNGSGTLVYYSKSGTESFRR